MALVFLNAPGQTLSRPFTWQRTGCKIPRISNKTLLRIGPRNDALGSDLVHSLAKDVPYYAQGKEITVDKRDDALL